MTNDQQLVTNDTNILWDVALTVESSISEKTPQDQVSAQLRFRADLQSNYVVSLSNLTFNDTDAGIIL